MPRTTKQNNTFIPKTASRSASAPEPRFIPAPAPRSVPAPALRSVPAPTPAPTHMPAPAQTQSHSMFDTMKQGFSFGIGSAIAHRLFDPSPHKNEVIPRDRNEVIPKNEVINESKLTTDKMYELYNKCLEKNDTNIDCTIILQNNTCN